ncbi:aminotransferase class III-fold pyridoxal phosphate-dependent enzyme [uncultured Tateyamaria sp.]|uniref:aspartate aminotransferase family protein n=1 Tax=Tateyamaria sp. 1078 TaxID=3417464 RepID=UPI00263509D4|nr:aminotransferase class III-fold pyridoxal phosphate-dependent enzyme [uncultured Tateyamaria sp.]
MRNFEPIYIDRAKGAWVTDIDGNSYLDMMLGMGSALLGHGADSVTKAVATQMQKAASPGSTLLEARAAARIVKHVPCAELVRFTCSGTEANLGALRVARAATGRSTIIRFNGHYHGSADELLGGVPGGRDGMHALATETPGDVYSSMVNTAGRHPQVFEQVLMLPWNDVESLRRCMDQHGHSIAAILMEPVMLNNSGCLPRPGYLQAVRDVCDEYGSVLIFDEVLTGFRMSLGGAQKSFGVTPDLTVLGKAIGNGFPVSAFCGTRQVMSPLVENSAVIGGTYNGHPLAMAAVCAALDTLADEQNTMYLRFRDLDAQFREGLMQLAKQHGHSIHIHGFPGACVVNFSDTPILRHEEKTQDSFAVEAAFNRNLVRHGVLSNFRLSLSAAHTSDDIDYALKIAAKAFSDL